MIFFAKKRSPRVVLVANAYAKSIVYVGIDLDRVSFFELQNATTQLGVADHIAQNFVHVTLVLERLVNLVLFE